MSDSSAELYKSYVTAADLFAHNSIYPEAEKALRATARALTTSGDADRSEDSTQADHIEGKDIWQLHAELRRVSDAYSEDSKFWQEGYEHDQADIKQLRAERDYAVRDLAFIAGRIIEFVKAIDKVKDNITAVWNSEDSVLSSDELEVIEWTVELFNSAVQKWFGEFIND